MALLKVDLSQRLCNHLIHFNKFLPKGFLKIRKLSLKSQDLPISPKGGGGPKGGAIDRAFNIKYNLSVLA
jgi:hypothetical protein